MLMIAFLVFLISSAVCMMPCKVVILLVAVSNAFRALAGESIPTLIIGTPDGKSGIHGYLPVSRNISELVLINSCSSIRSCKSTDGSTTGSATFTGSTTGSTTGAGLALMTFATSGSGTPAGNFSLSACSSAHVMSPLTVWTISVGARSPTSVLITGAFSVVVTTSTGSSVVGSSVVGSSGTGTGSGGIPGVFMNLPVTGLRGVTTPPGTLVLSVITFSPDAE